MNGWIFSAFTWKALTAPKSAPTATVIRMISRIGIPRWASSAEKTPANAAIAPGERSIWPAMMR